MHRHIIRDESSARAFLEAKVAESLSLQAGIIYLLPADFEGIIRHGGDGLLGWRPSVVTPDYNPLFRDRMGQINRVRVGLNKPGAGRFSSLAAVVSLMGAA